MNTQTVMETLTSLDKGAVVATLAEELEHVIAGALVSGRPGEVTLKLKIRKSKHGNGALDIDGFVNAKVPQPEAVSTMFFLYPDGRLSRRDPNQPELPLSAVDSDDRGDQEMETVAHA